MDPIAKEPSMSTSEARRLASQINGSKSKGPITPEGKAASRRNSLKHGMTGAGVVLPEEDAAEIERRFAAFQEELNPTGEVGQALARRAAVCSVRMERAVSQETAALSERVRQAEADFVAPEGTDEATVSQLRDEARAIALFDPSKEATLARKYEAAAERGFFRALKELRELKKQAKAIQPPAPAEPPREELGSFLTFQQLNAQLDVLEERLDRRDAEQARQDRRDDELARIMRSNPASAARNSVPGGSFEVPLTIGRRR
jgi:hypothetical protein